MVIKQALDEKVLSAIEREEESEFPIARLLELGREQGYVTLDNIIQLFPDAEQNVSQLEEVFAALLSANIPYIEDSDQREPNEEDLSEEQDEVEEEEPIPQDSAEDFLAHVEINDTVGLYLKEAGRVPLLTQEQEIQLSKRIVQGRESRDELARGVRSSNRRKELQIFIQDGWSARDHLITANARLVISVAKKYMGRGVPFLDLIQEGNIGLMRAAKKYDHRRGDKFSTYATWWIRQAITRSIADQGRTIRVPVHMGDQVSRMLRMQHRLKQELGRDPNMVELAEALEVPEKRIEEMIQLARHPLSLQMPIGEEEDEMLGDFIEDENAPPPENVAAQNLLQEELTVILDMLPPREARILKLRYGLIDGQHLTLNEVGHKMGVTRERVRQIEAQALKRLRTPQIRQALKSYLD
jgi:RNA polymerase primary sigma factor